MFKRNAGNGCSSLAFLFVHIGLPFSFQQLYHGGQLLGEGGGAAHVARHAPAQLPVLVVTSSAGSFTDPDRLAAWARRLPHGSATSVQCLHWPMTECPDDVSREMTRWLNAEFPKSNN